MSIYSNQFFFEKSCWANTGGKYMNITLDLSKGQLSKLRNGHGIRITPTMLGSDVDLIIDPMTYHNMAKKRTKEKVWLLKWVRMRFK